MCVSQKNKISFYDCNFSLSTIKMDISNYSVDTSTYNFPVNSSFNVFLYNSRLTFAQRIQFMCGMTFYGDADSSIVFEYQTIIIRNILGIKTNEYNVSAQLSILDRSINYWDNESNSFITNDHINIAHSNYGSNIFGSSSFWKKYSSPKIKFYGKILFKQGNSTNYKLVGPIDFNESNIGYIDSNGKEHLYSESTSYSNPFEFLNGNNVKIKTFGFDFMLGYYKDNDCQHMKGYSRPLISNGKAYAVDSSNSLVGTYSFKDGIFRCNNKKLYYFNNDQDFGEGEFNNGESGDVTIKECTYDENTKIINDNGQEYIYFASMYGKYTSSNSTVEMNRLTKGGGTATVKLSQYGRWLRA